MTLPPPVAPPPSDCSRKPEPKLVIEALSQLPHIGARATQTRLDLHEQMIIHQLDMIDAEERDRLRSGRSLAPSSSVAEGVSTGAGTAEQDEEVTKDLSAASVFGVPLRKSGIYATTSVLLGGWELELPIVVVSCVEELYRTGLYQPSLFHTLPDPNRLRELVDAFNNEEVPGDIIVTPRPKAAKRRLGTAFGGHISLHLETTSDICSLLSTYLMSLPEPVFIQGNSLFDAMWDWCEVGCDDPLDSDVTYDGKQVSFVHPDPALGQAFELDRIRAAQLVLHLLPSPNFDLLIYLLAFFSQVVLVEKENGLGVVDLARMFGEYLFGNGAVDIGDSGRRAKRRGSVGLSVSSASELGRGPRMMCWLLKRWGRLSRHLFDIPRLLDQTVQNPEIRPPSSPKISFALDSVNGPHLPFEGSSHPKAPATDVNDFDDALTQSFSDMSSTYTYTKDLKPGISTSQDRSSFVSASPKRGGTGPSFNTSAVTDSFARIPSSADKDLQHHVSPERGVPRSPEGFEQEQVPQSESPGQVHEFLEEMIKSCGSESSPTKVDLAGTKRITSKTKLPSRIPVVVLPLDVKVCDRLMDVSMPELAEGGLDPTAIIFHATQRTKSGIPVRAKLKRSPQPQQLTSTQRIEKMGDRNGSQNAGSVGRVEKDLSQLEEELRALKEQNTRAFDALEQATRQISSLEAELRVAHPKGPFSAIYSSATKLIMAFEVLSATASPQTQEATLSISSPGVQSGLNLTECNRTEGKDLERNVGVAGVSVQKDYEGALVLHSNNPFDDRHSPLSHPHSHHLSNNEAFPSHPQGERSTHAGAGYADDEVRLAAEHLAQTLEAAASQEVNEVARKNMLRQAKKIRKKAKDGVLNEASKEKKPLVVLKNIGCGFLLLLTTPVYLSGVVVEGTGTMLKATGMIVKGLGTGMKGLHTFAMDKLNIHI
ncbi:hypothetical protein MD484_g2742, partial [Candolleomyces efflorescens]